jgi:hypothetical protein
MRYRRGKIINSIRKEREKIKRHMRRKKKG